VQKITIPELARYKQLFRDLLTNNLTSKEEQVKKQGQALILIQATQ
jgi:hypothetical protein